jgi:propanol-preferring alcohol dehydrogenase
MRSYDVTVFDRPLERSERPTPEPTGEEVLVKVTAAGVCHSDLHICEGFFDLGGGKKLEMGARGVNLPLTMGHEIAGEIVAAGPDSEAVNPGRKVVVFPWIGCGKCPICARGDEQNCSRPRSLGIYRGGGYATHVLVPHARYLLDMGDLKPEVAAPYACSGLTTYSALRKIDPRVLREEPILVIGAGGLGLMCLGIMKALGAHGAVVADIDAGKREAAMQAGALAAVDPRAPDAVKQVRALSRDNFGVYAAVDYVGATSTVQLGIDSTIKGGHVVVVGLIGGEITISTPLFPQKALKLQGSYVGSLSELRELLDIARAGRIPQVPTTTRPLDEANAALDDLRQGRVIGRQVLVAA